MVLVVVHGVDARARVNDAFATPRYGFLSLYAMVDYDSVNLILLGQLFLMISNAVHVFISLTASWWKQHICHVSCERRACSQISSAVRHFALGFLACFCFLNFCSGIVGV